MYKLDRKLIKVIGGDITDNLEEETYVRLKKKLLEKYRAYSSEALDNELLYLKYKIERLKEQSLIYEASSKVLSIFLSLIALFFSTISTLISADVLSVEYGLDMLINIATLCTIVFIIVVLYTYFHKESDISIKNTKRFYYNLKIKYISEVIDERQKEAEKAVNDSRKKCKVRIIIKH
ncbi:MULTISPECIES: hypothetical protein [unclassified Ruminococcus]|uniref:hypothetical protein n=1 Tax=unclassified Ruminococcus TaxID=2608920 RepID=UPI00210E811E|nr:MULTISPECIES: hypothetical protein [unclassified Ruminococcus]MCQ4021726.1 hypothetical protein [Ruminococcus sp. zg-924]MCQ4114170.1 hypothetical protein [Ruminococcus sp. zg-921]